MGRACRRGRRATSGRLPDSCTLIRAALGYARARRAIGWPRLPSSWSGAPPSSGCSRTPSPPRARALGRARAGRRAGHRQDAPAGRARRPAPTPGPPRALGQRLGARARAAVLGLRRRARRVRRRRSSRAAWTRWTRRRARSSRHVLPSLRAARAARGAERADERYRTHRAVRQLLEALAEPQAAGAAARRPALGRLRARSSCSARCCAARRRRRCCSRWPCGRASCRSGCRRRSSAPHRGGALTRLELRRADRGRGARAARRGRRRCDGAPRSTRRAAATRSTSSSSPARRGGRRAAPGAGGVSLAGVEVPRAVAAALTEELALLPDPTRRVLEGAAVAGDPFEPELAAAAAGMPGGGGDGRARRAARSATSSATPTCPRRFRFRHPLVRARRLRGRARRLAARRARARPRRRSRPAARPRSSAPTTSSAPPATATSPPSRCCAKRARRLRRERRRRRRACSRRRCGCCPRPRLRTSGPPLLGALAGAHVAAGRFRERPRRDAREPRPAPSSRRPACGSG